MSRISKLNYAHHKYTRIETGSTVEGVSDIEYIAGDWSGWIELKTATWPRPGRAFGLHAAYTLAQCSWLIHHHRPQLGQRSWVLIGCAGVKHWTHFVLVPAPLTTHLLDVRKGPAHERLLSFPGVGHMRHLSDVLQHVERS